MRTLHNIQRRAKREKRSKTALERIQWKAASKPQIKLPSFTLQRWRQREQKPDDRSCSPPNEFGQMTGVFAQAIVACAQIRRKGSVLTHCSKFIRQWNKPTQASIRKCAALDTNISGEHRTMTSLNIGPTVCVSLLGGACACAAIVCAPTNRPGSPNGRRGQI